MSYGVTTQAVLPIVSNSVVVTPLTVPNIIAPTDNETLTSDSELFTLSNPDGATVALRLGSTVFGDEYYNSGGLSVKTEFNVTGLPTDGSAIYGTYLYNMGSGTVSISTEYTAHSVAVGGYSLLSKIPLTSKTQYIDYTDLLNPVIRNRVMKVGADEDLLEASIDLNNIYTPNADKTSVQAAIDHASANGGGVVIPVTTSYVEVDNWYYEMKSNVILDLSNVGEFRLQGTDDKIVEFTGIELFAITNVNVAGNTGKNYGVWSDGDCRHGIIQVISTEQMDNNSIDIGDSSEFMTVRYCDLKPGRNLDGLSGTERNQHGIVSSEATGADAQLNGPPITNVFGLKYSHSHAFYSNKCISTDGLGIDSHASNSEFMGNHLSDCRYGAKFPHSSNVMIHNNFIGDARSVATDAVFLRMYEASLWNHGIGYENDMMFVFDNTFGGLHSGSKIRITQGYGAAYVFNNNYPDVLPYFDHVTEDNEDEFSRTDERNGSLNVYGTDATLTVTGDAKTLIKNITNSLLQNNDTDEMIRMMNIQKDQSWEANVLYPLPTVVGY